MKEKIIAPGVPDIHSYRTALEMGYEVHSDGLWWPEYDWSNYDASDFNSSRSSEHIHAQRKRLGVKFYSSPDNQRTKQI